MVRKLEMFYFLLLVVMIYKLSINRVEFYVEEVKVLILVFFVYKIVNMRNVFFMNCGIVFIVLEFILG